MGPQLAASPWQLGGPTQDPALHVGVGQAHAVLFAQVLPHEAGSVKFVSHPVPT
jgi:hypothetical protein